MLNIFIKSNFKFTRLYLFKNKNYSNVHWNKLKFYKKNNIFQVSLIVAQKFISESYFNCSNLSILTINLKNFNYLFFKLNIILKWVNTLTGKYLKRINQNIDYKSTLDIILLIHLNLKLPWLNSVLWVNFFLYQLYLIKLKKDQLYFIRKNYKYNKLLLNIFNINSVLKQYLINNLSSILQHIKGRSGNLRWVKSRYLKTTNVTYSKYNNNYIMSSNINYFTTKWGSVSIRLQSHYKSFC